MNQQDRKASRFDEAVSSADCQLEAGKHILEFPRYLCAILLAMTGWALVSEAQTVPGFDVETFAEVTDPRLLSFAADGRLFVGRDNAGSGGGVTDPVKIYRVSTDGVIVEEYGDTAITDPDAVIVDQAGVFGVPGAVLVGGIISNSVGGQIKSVAPDQTVNDLFGPTTTFHNPTQFAFDQSGRLLFTNAADPVTQTNRGIFSTSNAADFPTSIHSTSINLIGIDVDDSARILVSTQDGRIQTHQLDGALIDDEFTLALDSGGPIKIGTLGPYVDQLFMINAAGDLFVVDLSDGEPTLVGEGFDAVSGLAFGPDGAMYVSEFDNDRVLRIAAQDETVFSDGFESASRSNLHWNR